MPDDDRDFIERAESVTSRLYGKPASIDQIAAARNFERR